MKLICPYCEALLDIESNECCGESGHGVELLKRRIYFVSSKDTTPDEPQFGWYVSPKFEGGRSRWFGSIHEAREYLEETP